jgi:uncharacterized protein (TIGR03435 family)
LLLKMVVVLALFCAMIAPKSHAQAVPAQPAATVSAGPKATTPAAAPATAIVPDWVTAAGGKMEFDVASVKQNKSSDIPKINIPMGGDTYVSTGGIFSASNMPLIVYMAFAYKITGSQWPALQKQLPGWVTSDHFDIEAKSDNHNPTKDQMRLMMQALLADRFKLAAHTESQESSVFAMVVAKAGKLGPHLRPQPADDTTCATAAPPSTDLSKITATTIEGGYPASCGALMVLPGTTRSHVVIGARNVPIKTISAAFGGMPDIGRPIVDETGLTGMYDFVLEFSPDTGSAAAPSAAADTGATFLEALSDQLGLKLVASKHAVDAFVVDHVEHPSAN